MRINPDTDEHVSQSGSVVFDSNNQVGLISVWIKEKWSTVGDLIDTFGPPEFLVLLNPYNHENGFPCDVWRLLYPNNGLDVIIWQGENIGEVKDSEYIAVLDISQPWNVNDRSIDKNFEMLLKWNGYGDYCSNVKSTP